MSKDSKAPKKSDSPTAFDSKEFQESLMDHVRQHGGSVAVGGQGFIQGLVQSALQAMLEVEMEEHLGYPKNAAEGRGTGNSRNGRTKKRVRGDFGEIDIDSPRDRDGSFEPQIVPKRQKDLGDFSQKIISLYARGLTTREISEHLKEMYGIDASAQFISRATEAVQQEVIEWQSRPLERLYPVVYVDGLRVSVRSEETGSPVLKKCLYIVLGISVEGRQEVLGTWMEKTEGAKFWLNVFNDLKSRGLEDILILCGDGLPGLPDAVEAVYPDADVQLCVVHQIRNATKFVSYKDRKAFCADMKPLYSSPNLEAAELALEQLADKWGKQYPASIASWRRNWHRLSVFYAYPVELRKWIYTTNTIESLNAQIRKNSKNRKVFPNDKAVHKLVYLNIKNFTKRWTKRQGWSSVMNQLTIIFGERIQNDDMLR